MKNKKTLVLGATTKPEKSAFKITALLRKGHSSLRLVKMRRELLE
jgi:predicted CoA-binding protein